MNYCGSQIRPYIFRGGDSENIPRISCTKVGFGQDHAKKRGRGFSLPFAKKQATPILSTY
jgi:hypothetical protein